MSTILGKVKRLTAKGFGFLVDDQGNEYFFHNSEVGGKGFDGLREGDRVRFEPEESSKGPRASNVVPQ
jgi:CspA family cold shock protein